MRNIAELNINEGGRPVLRKPPSDELIREYERTFNVILPSDYVAFLRQVNGGHPERDSFSPSGVVGSYQFGVNKFYHLSSEDRGSFSNIFKATTEWREALGDACFPIANDGGGNQIYVDTSKSSAIFICIHDDDFRKIFIADSFSEFLDLLEIDPDMI